MSPTLSQQYPNEMLGYAVPLTRGLYAIVSPEDYDSVMQFKWHAAFVCGIWYASRKGINRRGDQNNIMMHGFLEALETLVEAYREIKRQSSQKVESNV